MICLLENDSLIYKLNTDTDYILEMKDKTNKFFNSAHTLLCVINVKIKGNRSLPDIYADLIV